MTPELKTHLSEEALDDVLIGLGTAESHAHLDGCAECRSRVAAVRGDVALFNAASMAWSESHRRPIQIIQHPARRVRAAFAGWAALAAALVLMAVGIWRHRAEAPPRQAVAPVSQPIDTETQIAQDNQLLQAVNAAISPDEASPLEEYKILESPHSYKKAHSKTRTK